MHQVQVPGVRSSLGYAGKKFPRGGSGTYAVSAAEPLESRCLFSTVSVDTGNFTHVYASFDFVSPDGRYDVRVGVSAENAVINQTGEPDFIFHRGRIDIDMEERQLDDDIFNDFYSFSGSLDDLDDYDLTQSPDHRLATLTATVPVFDDSDDSLASEVSIDLAWDSTVMAGAPQVYKQHYIAMEGTDVFDTQDFRSSFIGSASGTMTSASALVGGVVDLAPLSPTLAVTGFDQDRDVEIHNVSTRDNVTAILKDYSLFQFSPTPRVAGGQRSLSRTVTATADLAATNPVTGVVLSGELTLSVSPRALPGVASSEIKAETDARASGGEQDLEGTASTGGSIVADLRSAKFQGSVALDSPYDEFAPLVASGQVNWKKTGVEYFRVERAENYDDSGFTRYLDVNVGFLASVSGTLKLGGKPATFSNGRMYLSSTERTFVPAPRSSQLTGAATPVTLNSFNNLLPAYSVGLNKQKFTSITAVLLA